MAFNAARQSFAFSVVTSMILSALFAVRYSMAPYPVEGLFEGGMPPAALMTRFSAEYPWVAAAITAAILVAILFILVQLTIRYTSVTSRNYLSIQFFLIAACGMIIPGEALASYTAALVLLLSMRQFISTFRKEYRFEEAFRAGFYLGLLPLLYAPSAVLLLLVPVAMSLYRRSYRELTVCVTGALLPVAAAGFIYWAAGHDPEFIYTEIWRCTAKYTGIEYPGKIPIIAAICAALLILLSVAAILWYVAHRKGIRTKQRKVMAHVSFLFLALLATMALPGSSPTGIPLASVAVAMAAPYAFSGKQAVISSVIYCFIIVAVLTLNLFQILGINIP